MKAKLRAWLIGLVREAIKLEAKQALGLNGVEYTNYKANTAAVLSMKPPTPQPIVVEPSFEQMQTDALKAQEKYYEPAQN